MYKNKNMNINDYTSKYKSSRHAPEARRILTKANAATATTPAETTTPAPATTQAYPQPEPEPGER